MKVVYGFVTACLMIACDMQVNTPKLEQLNSPTTSLVQAISIVDDKTVWISGHQASVVRSLNQGQTWELFQHPTGDTLQFRDIYAFDEEKAILMSAGPGPLSRLFTFQAPDKWEENFMMQDSMGFLDCIDFWDSQNGIAYGDAIDNYPYILLTQNGGQSWSRADTTGMPKAREGEGGFAASGTCVTTGQNGNAWIATGAGGNARIISTKDYGRTWRVIDSPVEKGEFAGHTSISFQDEIGFITGGDLSRSDEYADNCAYSFDKGDSWTLSNHPQTKGAFYGGSLTFSQQRYFTFICSPKGIDYSVDFGKTWNNIDTANYWAITFAGNIGYASGTDGKILKITL